MIRARIPPAESLRRALALRRYAVACRKDLDILKARERAIQAVLDAGQLDDGVAAHIGAIRAVLRDVEGENKTARTAIVQAKKGETT